MIMLPVYMVFFPQDMFVRYDVVCSAATKSGASSIQCAVIPVVVAVIAVATVTLLGTSL